MSVTTRELIMRAIVAALNDPSRPSDVPAAQRSRITGMSDDQLPAMVVYPVKEETERLGQLTRRLFVFRLECITAGGADPETPVDGLLDPMVAWGTRALAGSKLGGLSQDTQELGCEWDIEARDYVYARASMDFGVRYVTPAGDQTAR